LSVLLPTNAELGLIPGWMTDRFFWRALIALTGVGLATAATVLSGWMDHFPGLSRRRMGRGGARVMANLMLR
jgi:hypothetical protein